MPRAAPSTIPRPQLPPQGARAHDEGTGGARNEGSGNNEARASAARRVDAYAPSAAASSSARCAHAANGPTNDPKATAAAVRRVRTARAAIRTAEANGSDVRCRNEGSGDDEAEVSTAWRAYPSAPSNLDEAMAVAVRRTSLAARRTSKGGDTDDGAFDEGSDDNETRASALPRYASSNEDEASALAARHGRAVSAARRMTGGGDIANGTSDEGFDDDEADTGAARRKYGRSTASDNDKAGATVKRLVCAARAARPSDGKHPRLRHPSGRKATHTAAKCSGATKVARRMGMGKAAANDKRNDVSFCDACSDINA